MQEDGVHFKSTKTGKTLLIRHVDISDVEWLRVAKGFEVKLITVDGQIRKFDGFKESVSRLLIESVSVIFIVRDTYYTVQTNIFCGSIFFSNFMIHLPNARSIF